MEDQGLGTKVEGRGRSGRRREEIGYVSYHGTSTVLNDVVESRCVREVFGGLADALPGSSVKSMIGHPQGASGAAGTTGGVSTVQRASTSCVHSWVLWATTSKTERPSMRAGGIIIGSPRG